MVYMDIRMVTIVIESFVNKVSFEKLRHGAVCMVSANERNGSLKTPSSLYWKGNIYIPIIESNVSLLQ